jgi:hypothetical protein
MFATSGTSGNSITRQQMPKIIVDIMTDENGYFAKTVAFNASDAGGMIQLSATLLSPFATALEGSVHIEAKRARRTSDTHAFTLWHSETLQLGSWSIAEGDNIIVMHGKTNPSRVHTRVVLEIDATP